jgi:hypothetical protein
MGTLVVVHGAGVRGDGIPNLERDVRNGIRNLDESGPGAKALKALDIRGCAWGPEAGARPANLALTLPKEVSTRAIDGIPDEDLLESARWALLFDDPLFELRVLAQAPAATDGPVIGDALPAEAARMRVLEVAAQPGSILDGTGVTEEQFATAATSVAESEELGAAADAVGSAADLDLADMVARAITATLLASYREAPPGQVPALVESTTIRDAFAVALAEQLAPDGTRGAIDWFKAKVGGFLAKKATALASDHRLRGQEGSAGVVGDVTFYLRRGAGMADVVARSLEGLDPPVVALGHSLGGIVLVDLLSRSVHPHVDLLVTVGSQAPVLYAYDALERARDSRNGEAAYSKDHPPFTPWLNIYNRNDFLSFLAAGIFQAELGDDTLRIWDQELHVPEAFPAAHGAYWYDDWTFKFIAERVAQIPAFAALNQ